MNSNDIVKKKITYAITKTYYKKIVVEEIFYN